MPLKGDKVTGPLVDNNYESLPSYQVSNAQPRWIPDPERERRTEIRRRWLYGLAIVAILLSGWAWTRHWVVKMGPGHSGHEHPHDEYPDFPEHWENGAEQVECAVFDENTQWKPNPGHVAVGHESRSVNTTFSAPIRHELFVHLTGSFPAGNVHITTLDDQDHAHDDLGTSLKDGHASITVETTIDYPQHVDIVDSNAYEYLLESKICLLTGEGTDGHKRDGLGIWTPRWDRHQHGDGRDHVHFNTYVVLPSRHNTVPADVKALTVPYLDVACGSGNVKMTDTAHSLVGRLNFALGSGNVKFHNVRVGEVNVHTGSGEVVGDLAVWEALRLKMASGNTVLDLTLAEDPKESNTMPYIVDVSDSSGNVFLGHVAWEDTDRVLSESIRASSGNIRVVQHPVYEGPFSMTVTSGNLNVEGMNDDIEDPLGKGRKRHVDLHRNDRFVSKNWKGEVRWDSKGDTGSVHGANMDLSTTSGNIKLQL